MVAEDKPILHVYLLGDLRLVYGNQPVTTLNSPRAQSLLAYLVLHAGTPQSRRHLAFLLWPDSSDDQARSNLRKLFHDLRRFVPEMDQFIEAQGPNLLWRTDAPYTLDVAELEQALERASTAADLEAAVGRYTGPLLQSCYDDWVLSERERLHQRFLDALTRLVDLLESQGDYRTAIHYAQRLLQQDPLHEDVYRSLMRLYALTDNRAAALHTFQTCALVLKRELDVEPSPATRQAYERLLKLEGAPVSASGTGGGSGPLIGHGREWQRLQGAWRAAAKGQPQWVVVSGAPGMGKTRLVEELVHWATKQGIASASARGYAAERGVGYGPVASWLRARPVPELEPVWRTELARLWPELLSGQPGLAAPGPLVEPWQKLRFFEALARALLASQPLILVLDDLPFCDSDSLEFVHYLLRYNSRAALMLVSTLCWEDVPPEHGLNGLLASWRRTGQLTEIAVQGLSMSETRALGAQAAGRDLTEAEGAALYRETEGNPLFILEMVRAGTWGRAGEGRLPRTIQTVIASRLGQLSPEARALAEVAAVIGRSFGLEVLAEASGLSEVALGRALAELRQRRVVRAPTGSEYDFDHSKIREVVYESLNPAERRRLHRRVAEALERRSGGLAEALRGEVSGEIAAHLEAAGQRERAVPYELAAGEAARRRYANETAIRHYRGGKRSRCICIWGRCWSWWGGGRKRKGSIGRDGSRRSGGSCGGRRRSVNWPWGNCAIARVWTIRPSAGSIRR
jgi:DNA-binding SARP family transcriptional activator